MAKVIADKIFENYKLDISTDSAGTYVPYAQRAEKNAVTAAKKHGLNLSGHLSKQATDEMVKEADIVLAMSKSHKNFFGERSNVYTISEYAGGGDYAIADPFGGGLNVYEECFARLENYIEKIAEKLEEASEAKASEARTDEAKADEAQTDCVLTVESALENRSIPVDIPLETKDSAIPGETEKNESTENTQNTGERNMIAIGCDHGGFELKTQITKFLDANNINYSDFGTYSLQSVDYPVYAQKVCEAVLSGQCSKGILICTTGIGVSIMANRNKGIRAALCADTFTAKMTRLHNDANVLCMGGGVTGAELAKEIVDIFIKTEFSGEDKHVRRVSMLS
jgi:ribose 5-phosphate isomerase B